MPTYANTANDLEVKLPQQFAPGDGLDVTLSDVSMRLVPMEEATIPPCRPGKRSTL